jgi:hypothetical protein
MGDNSDHGPALDRPDRRRLRLVRRRPARAMADAHCPRRFRCLRRVHAARRVWLTAPHISVVRRPLSPLGEAAPRSRRLRSWAPSPESKKRPTPTHFERASFRCKPQAHRCQIRPQRTARVPQTQPDLTSNPTSASLPMEHGFIVASPIDAAVLVHVFGALRPFSVCSNMVGCHETAPSHCRTSARRR